MINFATATIALLELLREALYASNAIEAFASGAPDRPFGAIEVAILRTLEAAFREEGGLSYHKAERLAKVLHTEMISNGENFSYQLQLLADHRISL